jgi:hypothetical protein
MTAGNLFTTETNVQLPNDYTEAELAGFPRVLTDEQLGGARTSELFVLLAHPEREPIAQLAFPGLDPDRIPSEPFEAGFRAAMFAIADEIDRRIPPRVV